MSAFGLVECWVCSLEKATVEIEAQVGKRPAAWKLLVQAVVPDAMRWGPSRDVRHRRHHEHHRRHAIHLHLHLGH